MFSKGYRPPSSYHSKDYEKRMAQLANLKKGREKKILGEKTPENDPFHNVYKNDIIRYLEEQFYLPETKKPIVLEEWQKRKILVPLFETDPATGLRKYNLALIGLPKKNGKSTLAAMIVNYFMFQDDDHGEIILTANSRDQSSWIIFDKVVKSFQMNPLQHSHLKISQEAIENKTTGTVIRIVAPNYRTAAGSNASLTVFDELWGFELDAARKFWDELTLSPARKQPLALVVTYAGYDQESLLYELYKKGLCKRDKKMFFLWSYKNLASWVTKKYLATQRHRLRQNTYLRLHENRWMSSKDAFIDLESWDKCIDENHTPMLPDTNLNVIVGVDVSTKGDSTAVVVCIRRENKVILVCHRKWQPTKKVPIDLEATVEKYIMDLAKDYNVVKVLYDPYQFHRSAKTLSNEGIIMVEFPQTPDHLTAMSQNIYDLIKGGNLVIYKDKEFRSHVQNSLATQTSRGWRIVKKSTNNKIDLVIALAMAALDATKIDTSRRPNIRVIDINDDDDIDWKNWDNL